MKMVGERPLNALMEGLADVRKAKVKEAYENATVKAKAGAGGSHKPVPPVAKAPPVKEGPLPKKEPPQNIAIEDEPPKPIKLPAKLAVRYSMTLLI